MDKTIKINLSGIIFQIEEDAYRMLRDYLQAVESRISNTPESKEIMDDVESRIAEIFQSQKGITGVISGENVESMISIIGKPEEFEQGDYGNEPRTYDSSRRRRLYRNPRDTIIGGVCGGLGAYLNIDPVWIRLIFIILAFAGGFGVFVYLALWIALPGAYSEAQKKELHGASYSAVVNEKRGAAGNEGYSTPGRSQSGNALNEAFRAVGNVFYVLLRIIMIAFGVTFVLAGFASLVTFVMTFFFEYPWVFFDESVDTSLFYLPDVLGVFMRPEFTPWFIALLSIVIILPLLALIYWGIRMIFWFRAKDWIVSLVALIIWVISLSALAMISFSEGISFAEEASSVNRVDLGSLNDTLYLKAGSKISSLKYDREISVPDNEYSLYINNKDNELYGKPEIRIAATDKRHANLEVERYSHGRTRKEAEEKAEALIYSYKVSDDTILVDQYYKVPPEYKWSGSMVEINILLPEGMVIWIDEDADILFDRYVGNEIRSRDLGGEYWRWSENGPVRTGTDRQE
jgi:phage shock protein PspC (stress-responsive transcriptional regulator)